MNADEEIPDVMLDYLKINDDAVNASRSSTVLILEQWQLDLLGGIFEVLADDRKNDNRPKAEMLWDLLLAPCKGSWTSCGRLDAFKRLGLIKLNDSNDGYDVRGE